MKTSLTGRLHTLRFSIRFAFPALLEMNRKTQAEKKNKETKKKKKNKTKQAVV